MLRALAFATALFLAAALPAAAQAGAARVQGLWWGGPEESGWGLAIIQHEDRLFCGLMVYDDTAHTTWFVMSDGAWNAAGTAFTGPLYWPRSPGNSFSSYVASRLVIGPPAGQATLAFTSDDEGTLTYSLASGARGEKRIRRFDFASGPGRFADLTDFWWGGPSQAGQAVVIVQQGDVLFISWLSYFDGAVHPNEGFPTWFTMPVGTWTSASTFEGRIYRPFGARWLGLPALSGTPIYPDLGPFRLTFSSKDQAVFDFTVLGASGSTELRRFPF